MFPSSLLFRMPFFVPAAEMEMRKAISMVVSLFMSDIKAGTYNFLLLSVHRKKLISANSNPELKEDDCCFSQDLQQE